ncbi:MAG: galactokinase [Chloroflexi bacterium]|nr:galactokinase [Chloroflexota bacterium]
MKQSNRKAEITGKFVEIFGQSPVIWGRAPGRVDLMGSHTDYNMGYVMTMAIDRDTWIAASPRADRDVVIYSMNAEGGGAFCLDGIQRDHAWPWTNYIRGMVINLRKEGFPLTGMNALVHSTVPFGSGLSSSAAFEMAAGVVFQQLGGFAVDPVRLALLGQKAENQFVGVNCGILDQYSSTMGQAGYSLLLDCRDLSNRSTPIAAGVQVVICDTRAERNLAGTEYGERRAQCEEGVRILRQFEPNVQTLRDVTLEQFQAHSDALPPLVVKRCQFIIEENQRVLDLAGALARGDRPQLGALYAASYLGARDLYEIGIPSMQMMMDAMLSAPGVIGARQAGAGFGGCMVALVEAEQIEAFAAHVRAAYRVSSGTEAQVYPVNPSAGAGPLLSF